MHTRLRQLAIALALVLATVSASALTAPAAPRGTAAVSSTNAHPRFAPTQAPARLKKRRGPVLTPSATAATTYSVSPGISVQRGSETGGGSSTQAAASPGVSVEKLTAAGGGGANASVTALSAGVSIEKLTAGGIGGVGSAIYIVSPGVSVQKLSADGGGNYSQFVVSPGVSVQRSSVGGNTLTTLITGGPAEGATLCDSSSQFTFAASSTDPSASFVFVYRIDGGLWQGPIKETHVTLSPLSNGPHFFEVAAIDELGNEDPNPASRHFTVDTLPPAILQLTAKPGVTSAVVTWTTDKPATSQVEYQAPSTTVWIKSALDSALVTAHSITLTGLSPAASYTYRARSADSCGQETISDPLIFVTAQDTPPTTKITGGPAEGTVVCDSTVTFTFLGTDESTPVDKLRYEYRLDGSSWTAPALATTALLSGLTDGPHTFEVAAVNKSGTADPHPAVRRFVVSARAPIVTAIRSAARDYRATITWTTDKATSSQVEYGPNADYGSATTLDSALVTAHTVTITGLIPLTAYHFRVKSSDGCHEAVSSDQSLTTTDILRPDLEVTSLTFPATAKAHDQITVSWNVQNNGPGDAASAWNDGVYLSPTVTLDPKTAILLGKFSAGLALGVGASYTQNQTLALPGLSAGRYYLIIAADSDNVIVEADETNNALAMPITFLKVQTLIATPSQVPLTLHVGIPATVTVHLTNLGDSALTNLTSTVTDLSPNIAIQFVPPTKLEPMESQDVVCAITATDASIMQDTATLQITSADGQAATVTLSMTVNKPQPNLVVVPASLVAGMLRGTQTLVEATVTNTGDAAATGLTVGVPNQPWLSLSSPAVLGDLAPGQTAKISLLLMPAAELPLGRYTGQIVVNGANSALPLPYTFTCITDKVGDLEVTASDEYTYFAADKPPVAGAAVTLTDPETAAVILTGVTDGNGEFLAKSIPEGNYNIRLANDYHDDFVSTVQVLAGKESDINAFLSRQLVTYEFEVVPIDIQDQYDVTLQPVFQTNVPAPVVTISPAQLDLSKIAFDQNGKATVYFTITNHGLIAADGVSLTFPKRSDFQLTPALDSLGHLEANSTIQLPVTVTNLSIASGTSGGSTGGGTGDTSNNPDTCHVQGTFTYQYTCGETVQKHYLVDIITGECFQPTTSTQAPNIPVFPPNVAIAIANGIADAIPSFPTN